MISSVQSELLVTDAQRVTGATEVPSVRTCGRRPGCNEDS